MRNTENKGTFRGCLLLYTAGYLFFSGIILFFFIINGRTFLWIPDGTNQHYPAFSCLCDYIRGIFEGQPLPMFNYSLGQGADALTTLSAYGFTDPVNVLAALLLPSDRIAAYEAAAFFRLWLTGASFLFYCRSVENSDRMAVVLGALIYTFSRNVLSYFARHPIHINWAYCFPFLLGSVELFFRKNRRAPLIITLFFNTLSSFYSAYMNALLGIIYVLIRWWFSKERKAVILVRIAGLYITGFLSAGIVLLPNIAAYLHYARSGAGTGGNIFLYPLSYYADLVKEIFTLQTVWNPYGSFLYVNTAMLPVLVFVLIRKGNREWKALLAVSLLMLCIPAAGIVMNGFGYPSNRWSYAFVFYTCAAFAGGLGDFREYPGSKGLSAKKAGRVLAAATLGITFAVVIAFAGWVFPDYLENKNADSFYASPGEEPGPDPEHFFRISRSREAENLDGIRHTYGLSEYWSTINREPVDFYRELGICDLKANSWITGLDERPVLFLLASVRYHIAHENDRAEELFGFGETGTGPGGTYENEYTLPVGYTLPGTLDPAAFDALDAVRKEQALVCGALVDGETESIPEITPEEAVKECAFRILPPEGAEEEKEGETFPRRLSFPETGGSFRLDADVPASSAVFLCLHDSTLFEPEHTDVSVTRKSEHSVHSDGGRLMSDRYKWGTRREYTVFYLGITEDEQNGITLRFSEKCELDPGDLSVLAVPTAYYERMFAEMNRYVLEDAYVGNDIVTGRIEVPENRILQFSIPYSRGWTVYVDGEKKDLMRSDIMYMAVPVTSGSHMIELRYRTPLLFEGAAVSLITWIFAASFFFMRKRRDGKGGPVLRARKLPGRRNAPGIRPQDDRIFRDSYQGLF
ncbi:MAG: YfhO family protein [Lachnospiraceae bacterium]|nr:YfhO family protein [Lachnospiraceae bacterium]